MIKPISKPTKKKKIKKPKTKPLSYYRNKADRLLQELGRKTYDSCEVCGKPMSCLHHVYPKSMSSILRYDLNNCVPLCSGCHLRHHSGDPTIHAHIFNYRVKEWQEDLEIKKRKAIREGFKFNKEYLLDKIKYLSI